MTDDATRFTFEEGYAKRSDMPSVFRAMHKKVETQHGVLIRGYRMDGEFTRGPIGRWCDSKHIRTEPTALYQHYMGGTHERVNRTMREKAAPMIQEHHISGQITTIITEKAIESIREAKLPENLWPEAVKYAIWLKNRSPSRALKRGPSGASVQPADPPATIPVPKDSAPDDSESELPEADRVAPSNNALKNMLQTPPRLAVYSRLRGRPASIPNQTSSARASRALGFGSLFPLKPVNRGSSMLREAG
jgi:hypothetical protein